MDEPTPAMTPGGHPPRHQRSGIGAQCRAPDHQSNRSAYQITARASAKSTIPMSRITATILTSSLGMRQQLPLASLSEEFTDDVAKFLEAPLPQIPEEV